MLNVEIVADLQDVSPTLAAEIVRQWVDEDREGNIIAGALFVLASDAVAPDSLPSGWQVLVAPVPAGLWDLTLSRAGGESRAVLALLGPVQPCLDALGVVLDLLETDDMFGAAAPRVQCGRRCCLQTLSNTDGAPSEWMPHAAIADLPNHTFPGDMLAPGLVLKPVLLTEFGDCSPPFDSLAGTLCHRLMSGRRSGFRTVVANRAAVVVAGSDCTRQPAPVAAMPSTDAARLSRFENDRARSWTEFRGESSALFERLTCRHLRARRGARPSLLLDMRNLGAGFNGTAFAALGAATGVHRAGIAWDVAILANERGAEFHDLERQFPGWPVYTSEPPSGFNVALRLSQPWHIDEMIDLHHTARLNAYLMLDTIAWDTVYVAPPHLDGTWQFLAATADSLLFISDFSRRRFRARFPNGRTAADTVCHLSFSPEDYTRPELLDCAESDYLLVMGNHLEHKDVSATAELLGSAFPLMRIETLGPTPWRSSTMVSHHSGRLPDVEVQRLYAAARIALFPSFYEGFGIPVVTALAYGRTLLARESGWLDEVAERCSPRGKLVTYRRRDDLVRQVERLLNGEPVGSRPLGTAVTSGRPRSWQDVGLQVEHSLRTLMTAASPAAWRAREHLVSQAVACRR